jgi:hypothetical protein
MLDLAMANKCSFIKLKKIDCQGYVIMKGDQGQRMLTINSSVSLLYQVLNLFSNFLMRTIFIIEHLNILKKANELCDYLIVGVSKDEVVQGYKNKLREAYLKRRLTWVSDAMKFLKIKKSKTVDFQKLECEELIDLI